MARPSADPLFPVGATEPTAAHRVSMRAGAAIVTLAGASVELLAERALYWPDARTLFVADVHLGKAAALRAGGVAIAGSRLFALSNLR